MPGSNPPHLVEIGGEGGISAQINVHGAQLWRLVDRDGTDLQWSGDAAVWSGRAPILFPIVGNLAHDHYHYRGQRYRLGRHGFAREMPFAVVEHSASEVLLRLTANAESRRVYPFEFQLDLRFSCSVEALNVAVSVSNPGAETLPFSFGFHPALRWPLEPGATRADHAIIFAEPEPAPISRLDTHGLIKPQQEDTPVKDRELTLADELFVDDALIFTQRASRSATYGGRKGGAPVGRQIRVDFDNLPLLGVWTKPGAHYICIEPWQGMGDPEGFAEGIFEKPAIIPLEPGASWRAAMTLTVVAP